MTDAQRDEKTRKSGGGAVSEVEHYRSEVATAGASTSVRELADMLAELAIGAVVIVDEKQRPIGMVTDRDLCCRVVAQGRDPAATKAEAVMTKPLIVASPTEPLEEIIGRMRSAEVRRIPVVRDDKLVGIVSMDDLAVWLGCQLDDLGEAMRREVMGARKEAGRRRRIENLEGKLAELRRQVEATGGEARDFIVEEIESLRDRIGRLLGRGGSGGES